MRKKILRSLIAALLVIPIFLGLRNVEVVRAAIPGHVDFIIHKKDATGSPLLTTPWKNTGNPAVGNVAGTPDEQREYAISQLKGINGVVFELFDASKLYYDYIGSGMTPNQAYQAVVQAVQYLTRTQIVALGLVSVTFDTNQTQATSGQVGGEHGIAKMLNVPATTSVPAYSGYDAVYVIVEVDMSGAKNEAGQPIIIPFTSNTVVALPIDNPANAPGNPLNPLTTIHIYPKNTTSSIDKNLAHVVSSITGGTINPGTNGTGITLGDVVYYTIDFILPTVLENNAGVFTDIKIYDLVPDGLTYVHASYPVAMVVDPGGTNTPFTNFAYAVGLYTPGTPSTWVLGAGNHIQLVLDSNALTSNNHLGKKMRVTIPLVFTGTTSNTFNLSNGFLNTAYIEFNSAYTTDVTTDDDVFTGGYRFRKVDYRNPANPVTTAVFALYYIDSVGKEFFIPVQPVTVTGTMWNGIFTAGEKVYEPVTSGVIDVSSAGLAWPWVIGCPGAPEVVQLIPSGATGAFRIINLADRATAGGRYELREVEVGMPYVLPTGGKEITPFVVLLDDPVASIIATVIDSAPSVVGNNDRLIYNELRGELPATGGIGMPTFFGIAAAGLVGMFFLWKRTNKHEETPVDID